MSAFENLPKVDRLRSRDGGRCWLCDKPIDFKAEPNSARAPSIEHLIAQCHGGPNTIDNLVLCHPPCNKELGNRSLAEKVRMREALQRKRWTADMGKRVMAMLIGEAD